MRIRTHNDITVNGIRSGYTLHDSIILRKETDYYNRPQIRTITMEDFEGEPAEERTYWCAICKSRLEYMKHTNTIWRCSNCMSYYDTKIQDTPIKNNDEFKLRAHHNPYQQFDNNDPNIVFVKGINPDHLDQEGVEVLRSSADQRVKTIRVKGNLAKALSIMNEIDG